MLGAAVLMLVTATHKAPPPIQTITAPPPLIRTELPPSVQYGDWTFEDAITTIWAYTKNDSGSVFGVVCGTTCVAYMNLQITCEKDHIYSALVNAPDGAHTISMKCRPVQSRPVLTVELDDDFITSIKKSGQIGFAVPMAGGKFQVSRFSLVGALTAASRVVDIAADRQKDDGKQLKDFTY